MTQGLVLNFRYSVPKRINIMWLHLFILTGFFSFFSIHCSFYIHIDYLTFFYYYCISTRLLSCTLDCTDCVKHAVSFYLKVVLMAEVKYLRRFRQIYVNQLPLHVNSVSHSCLQGSTIGAHIGLIAILVAPVICVFLRTQVIT